MSRRPSRRISKEEVKAVADRAAARAAGKDQDGADGRDAQKLITDAITEGELNAEIAKLAQLPPALYEHCRKDEAVRLRLRTSVLDKLVQAAWTKTKRTGTTVLGDGKIEDGHVVLDAVEKFLGRFISYPSEHARVAHALWIVHTHRMDCWHTTPRLAFMSAEPQSGKSRALETTELLVPGPLLSLNMSAAALVRCVAEGGATILYDEIDALFGSASREEANADVRSILNGGYRRGAKVHRCVMVGKRIEIEQLAAFAPVALAGLKNLPDSLASRAIIVRMRRRAPDETVESWRERRVRDPGAELCQRIANWAARQADLAKAEPDMPSGIVDRAAECWDPLLAVADAAGGDWPKRARDAAVHLVAGGREESTSSGVELLDHIREAFVGVDALATEVLLRRLHERPESPWKEMRGKPLNDRGLARRLKPYGIRSTKIRIGEATPRGYRTEDFSESWKRYLPPLSGEGVEQVEHVEQLSHCKYLDVPHVPDVPLNPSSNGGGAALVRDAAGHPDPRMAVDLGGGQFGTVVGATVGHCEQCGRSDGALYLIRGTREVAANLLHEDCAAAFFISEPRR